MKAKLSLVLLAGMLFSGMTALADEVSDATLTHVGQAAPAFAVTTLDGKTIDLKALRGKVVLVNFFATWCGPCMAEMPRLDQEVWQKFKGSNFVMVAIGREHTSAELAKFLEAKKFTIPLAADPKREVYSLYAKAYIPRNYVIAADGRIAFQSVGFDKDEFTRMIQVVQKEIEKSAAK